MKHFCLLTLSLVLAAACAAPPAQDSADLRAKSDAWEAAFNAGDIDTLASMYAENARLMPPNSPAVTGRDAVREAFGAMIAPGVGGQLDSIEAKLSGDLGYNTGTYIITVDGATAEIGKFVEIWRKIDGEWLITQDIWNSDAASGPAGTLHIATHEVDDPDVWVAAWTGPDSRAKDFKANGVASVTPFQSMETPKQVGLVIDVVDMDAFGAWLESEEGAAAKAEDTVIDATIRMLPAL